MDFPYVLAAHILLSSVYYLFCRCFCAEDIEKPPSPSCHVHRSVPRKSTVACSKVGSLTHQSFSSVITLLFNRRNKKTGTQSRALEKKRCDNSVHLTPHDTAELYHRDITYFLYSYLENKPPRNASARLNFTHACHILILAIAPNIALPVNM